MLPGIAMLMDAAWHAVQAYIAQISGNQLAELRGKTVQTIVSLKAAGLSIVEADSPPTLEKLMTQAVINRDDGRGQRIQLVSSPPTIPNWPYLQPLKAQGLFVLFHAG